MLGAFGAHGLKKRIADPQRIANWSTAAHYQVLHLYSSFMLSLACHWEMIHLGHSSDLVCCSWFTAELCSLQQALHRRTKLQHLSSLLE